MSESDATEVVDTTDDGVTTTSGTHRRWWATNDVLSSILFASLIALLACDAYGVMELESIPRAWAVTYLTICGISAAWLFGTEAIKTWRSGGKS